MEPSARLSASPAATGGGTYREAASRTIAGRHLSYLPYAATQVRLRLDLQRRAQDNLRRHVARAAIRFTVLVLADLLSFYVMRALVRGVRNEAVVGDWIAGLAQSILPAGILNGWQFASALFVSLVLLGCYGAGDQRRDPRRLFTAAALATALPLWMAIWIRGPSLVAMEFTLTTVLVWAGLLVDRLGVDRVVARIRSPEATAARTVFVGTAAECAAAVKMPAFQGRADFLSVGFVDTQLPPAPGALGHFVELARVIHEAGGEVVVVCGQLSDGQLAEVVNAALATGCHLLMQPRGIDVPGVQPAIVWRHGQPLMELTAPTLKGWQFALKRAMDMAGALAGLVLAAPVMVIAAVAIKLDSAGPVLFGHNRLGLNGRRFTCYKFRSMRRDADDILRSDLALWNKYVANNYKVYPDEDPRLTRVGRFLRKTSIDELPQLINVLKGEMSLVGPRPIIAEELEKYGQGGAIFLSLRPGITGAWQVNGRSKIGYPDRAALELDYVRNWSIACDVSILLRTILVVLSSRGAH